MGSVNRTGLEFLNSGCPNGINTWAEEALASLDPNKHKQTFATLLVIYLSISSELHPGRAQEKYTFPPRTKGPTRRLSGQELFAASISTLHQPGSLGRLNTVVNAFERIAEKGWSIDAMALIHLVERTTRDIILAERAITTLPWSYGGFSGLVVPLSWASSLVMHAKYPQTLRPPPTDAFARHLGVILIQLLSGIPERWKVLKNDPEVHNLESLTARLVWSISLLAVNLHPAHPALPTIFNVLKAPIAKGENFTPTLVTTELAALTINPDSFPAGFNQKLCLTLLTNTLRHDELVMLLGNHGVACPAKQGLVKRTIIFDNFAHLRAILFGGSKETTGVNFPPPFELHDPRDTSIEALPESPLAETTPHHEVDASQAHATTSLSRPETPLYFSDSQSQAEEEDPKDSGLKAKLTEEAALQRIQPAWRRAIEIRAQRRRLHEYTDEGRLYEEHRHNFPKMGKSADKREASALYLIRGPCLSIVLGLQMLVEEMGEYLEHIEDNLKGEENLTPKDVAEIQKTNKRNRELVKGYVAKANECLPPNKPPKIIKLGNISGIRNQTKVIWDIFMAVKNSKTLPHDDDFKAIEVQISHGREVILKALDKIFHNKADKVDKAGKAKKAGKAGKAGKVGKGGKKARKGKANKAR
ncbi:unnamed protein product [Rhizoctonia solani]|uniref:Uncharacterized protein n=1 Tax=Rhizoctonia solani TaxID=456999 RepID=A0A8H3C7U5_9AGAM|nr:unnamed protein product [Rhizoctonia solani]